MSVEIVAIRHPYGQVLDRPEVPMEQKSEYFSALSAASKARYEWKVIAAGLTTDPCCIEQWHEDLDSFLEVNWSDMILSVFDSYAKRKYP